MSSVSPPREYFLDSIRAANVVRDPIPYFIDLLHHIRAREQRRTVMVVNPFNDFIHAFRMQVFFVISGYFSYMLFALSVKTLVEGA